MAFLLTRLSKSGITINSMQNVQSVTIDREKVKELMEKELGITQARIEFSKIVEQVQHRGDSYIINRHGKPAAAVVPVQVYETWKRQRDEFFNQIRGLQQQADLDPEEAERLAAQAVASVRTES